MSLINLADLDTPQIDILKEINRTSFAYKWRPLDITKLSPSLINTGHRLNALGDNFYFIKIVLQKNRLSNTFHRQYCDCFLCWSLKDVFEIPRDHFKTTIGSVGMPMWWALPFTDQDEILMRRLGYKDEWITWMRRAHNQNTRTLIAMEIVKNAWKIGKRITEQYRNNKFFLNLFPQVEPDSSCQWTADTLTHKRDYSRPGADQGEGTYEFIGVDVALQSRHFDRIVCDDIYGREALKSDLVAQSTWEWFQLLVGAFDSNPDNPDEEIDQVVNGNRWSFHDLNWKIKKELPDFKFHTHDAEGGCCSLHPPGQPIFPEEWSLTKLAKYRHRLKDYFYSCQYRNKPIPPGGNVFKSEWLRYFVYKTINVEHEAMSYMTKPVSDKGAGTFGTEAYQLIPYDRMEEKRHMAVCHQIYNGTQFKDIPTSFLSKMLLVDPNHAGEKGRANNVVLCFGINRDPFNVYILDGFADNCSREDAVFQMYRMGEKWRLRTIWVETAAGQTWLKTLLEIENGHRKDLGKWYFYEVRDFKDNRNENAKDDRIQDMEPYFRRGQVWVCNNDSSGFTQKFLDEYNEYPHHITKDIMDTLGHGFQNMDHSTMSEKEMRSFVGSQQQRLQTLNQTRSGITGY